DSLQELGVALDLGTQDLLIPVRRVLTQSGDSLDDSLSVDLKRIKVSLSLSLFSSQGEAIASHRFEISCADSIFQEDCISDPHQLFLHWNFQSQNGRAVGTGAYIAQVRLSAWYDGASRKNIANQFRLETWGVVRNP
ncbi:MAG TPA: hypothetical protein VLM37_06995, partial [Fibrobacteraceae bacterium]|nr:hypothetical protein [Fibrobacteraceae bacterium]